MRVVFQSLTGRLKTETVRWNERADTEFQSLTGRLKTRLCFGEANNEAVSIRESRSEIVEETREANNEAVSIPHR